MSKPKSSDKKAVTTQTNSVNEQVTKTIKTPKLAKPKPEPKLTEGNAVYSPSRPLVVINILLIILVLIILGLVIGYHYSQLKTLQQKTRAISQQYAQSQKEYLKTAAQLENLKTDLSDQKADITTEQARMTQLITQFAGQQKHQQWQVAEIAYLVNLTNYALNFNHDPSTAYVLLSTADQAVRALDENSQGELRTALINLRKALALNLTELAKAKKQDITGLYVQISTAQATIAKAPLIGTSAETVNRQQDVTKASEETQTTSDTWKGHLAQGWQQLKSLIIVRDRADGLKPLIAQQGGDYIYQYIDLQLGQAQWALLQRDNTLYQKSLQQAQQWLARYFVASNADTQQALTLLKQLQAQDISVAEIDLAPTLSAVAELAHAK